MGKKIALFVCLLAVTGCASVMADSGPRVSNGSLVELRYDLEADGITVVAPAKPEGMRLVVGRGAYPAEFERQLIGLRVGDKKTITLRPEQAFGAHRKELVRRIPRAQLPATFKDVREGMMIQSKSNARPLRVIKIDAETIVLDQNYPLAGKKIVYHVVVKSIA